MWLALLGPLPKRAWFTNRWRLVYIIAVRLIGTVLANAMIFAGFAFYPYRDARWPSRCWPARPRRGAARSCGATARGRWRYLTVSVPFIPAASCPSTEQ